MNESPFEWDTEKAEINQRKHGVTFDEASSVFYDTLSSTVDDPLHSDEEDRFILIGMSNQLRLLVVVHVDRGDKIRIISARLANRYERRQYEQE